MWFRSGSLYPVGRSGAETERRRIISQHADAIHHAVCSSELRVIRRDSPGHDSLRLGTCSRSDEAACVQQWTYHRADQGNDQRNSISSPRKDKLMTRNVQCYEFEERSNAHSHYMAQMLERACVDSTHLDSEKSFRLISPSQIEPRRYNSGSEIQGEGLNILHEVLQSSLSPSCQSSSSIL